MNFISRAIATFTLAALMSTLMTIMLFTMSGTVRAQSMSGGDSLVVGGGVGFNRNYPGGDENKVRPALLIDYKMANGFFVSSARGVGYGQQFGALSLSAALGYDGGRSDSNGSTFSQGSARLKGMGDIDGGAVARLGASYKVLDETSVSVDANLAVSGRERGNTYKIGLRQGLLKTDADRVELGATATYGDAKNMQSYFGVTAVQSANTGYAIDTPKAGLQDVSANVAWTHMIDENWSVRSTLGVKHLTGDAADSPLTVKPTYPTGVVTFNYKF